MAAPSPLSPDGVIVALGANLGDVRGHIRRALAGLQSFSVAALRVSSLWETSPVDCPPGSPKFLNAVALLEPRQDETPLGLLAKLQSLEREIGRQPKKMQNEPRLIDLDLVAFGSRKLATPELVLPHPRAHLRRFVLQPLSEIAPDLVLPGQGKTVGDLLAGLKSSECLLKVG
jgi:2-amino-4-hydroxy-6-hydroxymethyldihydropteridine diphosphokinase